MEEREIIEKYASSKLTGEALQAFETRLAADPDFAAAVRQEVEMLHALRLAPEVDALRQQLVSIENERADAPKILKKQSARLVSMRWFLAAAASILIAAAILFLKNERVASSPEQIFAEHFHPPELLNASRRGEENPPLISQNDFEKQQLAAKNLYDAGDFKAALEQWEVVVALPEAAEYAADLNFYAGLTALRAGEFDAAVVFLEKIPTGSEPSDATWYLALAKLRTGKLEEARRLFEWIANAAAARSVEAKTILGKIQ